MKRGAAVGLVLVGSLAAGVHAEPSRPPALEGVGIEQHLGTEIPKDLVFKDSSGASVRLGDLIGKKPVVLDLVYYECPMLCTLVEKGLLSSFRALPFEVGKEFDVLTVSIDPKETPALAAEKRKNALAAYGRKSAASGWRFLTGDEASIRSLADAVGFRYRYDAPTDTFAHAAGIMVLTPEGKLSRYLYGVEYAPRDLRLALIEASERKIGTLADQMLLFCYHYDPATGRYSAATFRLVRVGGVLTVLALGSFILLSWRRESLRERHTG